MTTVCIVASLVFAWGCAPLSPTSATGSTVDASLGTPFELHVNDIAHVSGEALRVTFERVVEDSRCPADTTCVWAGDAVIRIRFEAANAESVTVDLHTHASFPREAKFQKFRVVLQGVAPARRDQSAIAPEQYVAMLVVFGN